MSMNLTKISKFCEYLKPSLIMFPERVEGEEEVLYKKKNEQPRATM